MSVDADIATLRRVSKELRDLQHAATLLSWDQETYMPAGGVSSRAGALAALQTEIHRRWASPDFAAVLDRLDGRFEPGSFLGALLRVCQREHARAIKLPPELVAARTRASSYARPIWRQAKTASDWSMFVPAMERILDVCIETAETIGYADERYDAMLELYEPGLTTNQLEGLLGAMRDTAIPLLSRLAPSLSGGRANLSRGGTWDRSQQFAFARFMAEAVGFDMSRGRLDLSAHPIADGVGPGDVRITTCLSERQPMRGLFGALHETGHGLYAQGLPGEFAETPLWAAASTAVDESQSRFWECAVGRSRAFWEHFLPHLKEYFPGQLAGVSLDDFYAEINKPSTSPVRLDADELTCNLHILVRFEIERELLQERLSLKDVPEAWSESVRTYVGSEVTNDAEGPLQDIHWSGCYIGTFTSYTVGDLIAAQLMAKARTAITDLDAQIVNGDFRPLITWLAESVYRHGASLTTDELVISATGEELSAAAWQTSMGERFTPLLATLR